MSTFPFVSVHGNPRERGMAYGRQARDLIRRSVALYSDRLGRAGLRNTDLADLVTRYVPIIENFSPDSIVEMRAIATEADVNFEEIVLVNARTEILALVRPEAAADEHAKDGCSCVAVLANRSANGELLHAQNWDWTPECADTAIVLRVEPDTGPAFLTFTEAGGLARNGFNSSGISLTANYLECSRDFRDMGVPLALIRRKILEQEHYAKALQLVSVTPKATSNNMMIAHKDGFAVSFECAPDEAFNVYPENDVLVHTNHWLNSTALQSLKTQSAQNWADSFYRDARLREHMGKAGSVSIARLKGALMDRFGAPFSVCRSPSALSEGNQMATVASILMVPAKCFMEVARLPAAGGPFQRYSLNEEPVAVSD